VRADRLVSLVLLLQARGRTTAGRLAEELGVSVRTVYRDLEALSVAGVPVLAEAGPGGGCQLLDGYRFPLRTLRPEEAEALLILGVPGALRELGLDAAAVAAHRQIQLASGLRHDEGIAPPALVHLDLPRWFGSQQELPALRTLAEALRRQRQLELTYRAGPVSPATQTASARPPSAARPRSVTPLGLVNKAGTWYLVGASAAAGRITVFRAERITSARVVDKPATRPEGFDLEGFWQQWSREFTASRPRLDVRLRASPTALAIMPEVFGDSVRDALSAALPPDERGWRELTLSFEHELAAAHRLAGFGGLLQVLSPPGVTDQLVTAARGVLRRYCAERG
jgi:predicted DNA-binding transcriptional regulator YafY